MTNFSKCNTLRIRNIGSDGAKYSEKVFVRTHLKTIFFKRIYVIQLGTTPYLNTINKVR